jgi:GGDEF domain-containing protein
MIETYNNEKREAIPLSVAIGFADFNSEKDRIEDIFRIADERMYEQKKKMKMEVGIS